MRLNEIVAPLQKEDVDGRHEAGHDEIERSDWKDRTS